MKRTIEIAHHGRTVEAVLYTPDKDSYPIAILSHGYGGTGADMDAFGTMLAEKGVGAIAVTFCGGRYTTSTFATTDMTLYTECEDLCAVMEYARKLKETQGKNCYLYGASQGGMVSTMAAARHPDWVSALLLLFPAFCIPDDWNTKCPKDEEIPEKFDFWGIELGRRFVTTLRDFDLEGVMRGYDGPTMIWHGRKDAVVDIRYAYKAVQTFHDVRLHVYPNEGHGFTESAANEVYEEAMAMIGRMEHACT